jgi:hypothetical protein
MKQQSEFFCGRNTLYKTAVLVVVAFLVTSCRHSQIQARYAEESGACRSMAESRLGALSNQMAGKTRDAELVTLFSDCMAKRNWQVATPKRQVKPGGKVAEPAKPATQPQPTAQPQPQPASAANTGSLYDAVPGGSAASGSGYRPVVNESPYATSPLNPNAATYQPAPAVQRSGPVAREFKR